MWQDLIAGAAVLLAFLWVLWSLVLPARVRDRLRRRAGMAAAAGPGGCGGCSGCGGRRPPPGGRAARRPPAGRQGRPPTMVPSMVLLPFRV